MENNKKMNNRKFAMTLAEILIVVVIVAIIGSVLIAMPRKNVSATDRTKYYIAYMTLYRLLNEQMADTGKIALRQNGSSEECSSGDDCTEIFKTINNDKSFKNMVDKLLNIASTNATQATLTNGMILNWAGNSSLDKKTSGITTQKSVWVDIDGANEGRTIDKKDKHYFLLYIKDGDVRVKPISGSPSENEDDVDRDNLVPSSNSSWLLFKVFRINSNGTTKIILLEKDYTQAYNCYDNSDNDACSGKCADKQCFIEPIPPLK